MIRPLPLSRRTTAAGAIAALFEARSGQRLDAGRAWRIDAALRPMLAERGLRTLDSLVARIEGGSEPGLADTVVDALLNQETSFFRDARALEGAVDAFAGRTAPEPPRRLRIWSAACSTGQEPLSLAMLCAERVAAGHLKTMPDIRATDMSARALRRARDGCYTQFEIQRGLPVRQMMRWFDPVGSAWTVKAELRDQVRYARHNLVTDPEPPGRFDLVLCRNVLLYLRPEMRRRVLYRIACVLRPDGLLLLGAGETVLGHADVLVPSERHRGLYRRTPG